MLIVTATCKRIDHTEIEAVSNVSIKDVAILVFYTLMLFQKSNSSSCKTERSIDAEEYEDNLPVKAAASHEYKFVIYN